jgi:DNA-binding CsgD family transcriptional regulator
MFDPAPVPSPAPRLRRRVPRRRDAKREASIFLRLRAGVSVPDIARAHHCSERTVRRIVARTLARRESDATGGYAQLQIERLNDALMVANLQMMNGDLRGLDRVLKVLQAQDRYHGFGLSGGPMPAIPASALAAPATRPPRLAQPEPQRALPAPDNVEKIDADKNPPITV